MALVAPKTILIRSKTGVTSTTPLFSANLIYDSDTDTEMEQGTRKRKRLTHLSPEERMLRRKLKNRVAAQTARDRKKAKMTDLESEVVELETENRRLMMENKSLKKKTGFLSVENMQLKERLGMPTEGVVVKQEPESESAAGTDSGCLPTNSTVNLIPSDIESDALLTLLEELAQAGGCDLPSTDPQSNPTQQEQGVVGPKTEELESLKELIRFDHIYYKSEKLVETAVVKSSNTDINSDKECSDIPVVDLTTDTVELTPSESNIVIQDSSVTPNESNLVIQDSSSNINEVPVILIAQDNLSTNANEAIPDTFDIDNILDLLTNDTVSVSLNELGAKDTVVLKEEPQTKKQKVAAKPQVCKEDVSPESFDFNMEYDFGLQQEILSPHSPLSASSRSESGYSSDGGVSSPRSDGGLSSPRSEVSSPLNDNEWEESFTQLFPSLF